jgi:ditrans,polycis-polyprenyl diphosphate synthase
VVHVESSRTYSHVNLSHPSTMSTSSSVWARVVYHLYAAATAVLLYILSLGPIPRHVAFVMDGNRRYARRLAKPTVQGHTDGFTSLRRVRPLAHCSANEVADG